MTRAGLVTTIGRVARLVGPGVAGGGEATLVMHELGELQLLHWRAQIARVRLDLVLLGGLGVDLLQRGPESSLV
jgi:hypothetical protein